MKKGEGSKAAAGGSIQGNGALGVVEENLRQCVVKGCRVAGQAKRKAYNSVRGYHPAVDAIPKRRVCHVLDGKNPKNGPSMPSMPNGLTLDAICRSIPW